MMGQILHLVEVCCQNHDPELLAVVCVEKPRLHVRLLGSGTRGIMQTLS